MIIFPVYFQLSEDISLFFGKNRFTLRIHCPEMYQASSLPNIISLLISSVSFEYPIPHMIK